MPTERRRRALASLLGIGGLVLVCTRLEERTRPPKGALAPCEVAVQVDGALRCHEAPIEVEDVCGRSWTLRDGDALDSDCDGPHRMAAPELAALAVAVDPNRASAAELQSWPGVGPVLARRIVQERPYAEAVDLLRVRGIGPKTLDRLRPRLRITASP